MEGDCVSLLVSWIQSLFQSTPSAWRVTNVHTPVTPSSAFQSTPSAWRVTLLLHFRNRSASISIHTLRVEGDAGGRGGAVRDGISIHTLRVEGDEDAGQVSRQGATFQSTPSAWRVTTTSSLSLLLERLFQSTPSAWRVTPERRKHFGGTRISIHTLRMEGDSPVSS